MTHAHGVRFAIFQLLLAVLFVCLAFLADEIWGDAAIKPMVIGYILVNGMIVSLWFGWFAKRLEAEKEDHSA